MGQSEYIKNESKSNDRKKSPAVPEWIYEVTV